MLIVLLSVLGGCAADIITPHAPVAAINSGNTEARVLVDEARQNVEIVIPKVPAPEATLLAIAKRQLLSAKESITTSLASLASIQSAFDAASIEQAKLKEAIAAKDMEIGVQQTRWNKSWLAGRGLWWKNVALVLFVLGLGLRIYGLMGMGWKHTLAAWIGNLCLVLSVIGAVCMLVFEPIYQKRYLTRK